MRMVPRSAAPVVVGGVVGIANLAVLRRMKVEYAETDTLSKPTVATMYAAYGAHISALAWSSGKRVWPVRLPAGPCRISGTALAAVGAGIAVAGARPFGAGAQISGIVSGSLHATGIYRYSRNPQYLGLGLAATGSALLARSAFAGLLAAGVWAAYQSWIPSEEDHLARVFGEDYRNYKATVPRWLGSVRTDQAA